MSVNDLRARMSDIPGIDGLTMQLLGGRQCFSWGNGMLIAVDPMATDQEIETAIRSASRLPSVALIPDKQETAPMTAPAPGSFAAELRSLMDEARAGIVQARTEGRAKVAEAVGKLTEAKTATANVAASMAKTIEDEAASVLAELGQISNLPPE
jgi:hypothetical protein